jgi:hypothetical protein
MERVNALTLACLISVSIALLFTACLFAATWWLYRATRKLVLGAEQAAERHLRAYVLLDPEETKFSNFEGLIQYRIACKNFGQTPAHEVATPVIYQMAAYPLDKALPCDWQDGDGWTSTIGPGASKFVTVVAERKLSGDERAAILEGTAAIYVSGKFHYRDIFGARHVTNYRLMIGGPVGVSANGNMVPCGEGNEAT